MQYDIISLDIGGAGGGGEGVGAENGKVVFSQIGDKTNPITSSNMPNNFGEATLFIDAGCSEWDPRC